MGSWQEETDFRRLLDQDELVQKHLSKKELDDIFNVGNFLTRLDYIFRRVFG